MQGFHSCLYSCSDFMNFLFFLYSDPYARFIYLEMMGYHSCRSQSTVHIKQFNFFCNVMTFLCFLGALPALLVVLRMGPMVLFKVQYCTEHDEKYARTVRDRFLLQYTIYWRDELLTWKLVLHMEISIIWCFKQALATFELTAITRGGYKIITVIQYVLQSILCSYDLTLHPYICLHFPRLRMSPCTVCKCLCVF